MGNKLALFRGMPALERILANAALLALLERLPPEEVKRLAALLPKLRQGMGEGRLLRGLPLEGVDTKFIESRLRLVRLLLNANEGTELRDQAELLRWLGCRLTPQGWVTCRPLCPELRQHYGNVALARITAADFTEKPPPAKSVLFVENLQCFEALPEMAGTVAVLGLGRNLVPLDAPWLTTLRTGYWGDLDTHGLAMLAAARTRIPRIEAVLMDAATYDACPQMRVDEKTRCAMPETGLTADEKALFRRLEQPMARLEQERLSQRPDFVLERLAAWHRGQGENQEG
jgi:hypothetical protein